MIEDSDIKIDVRRIRRLSADLSSIPSITEPHPLPFGVEVDELRGEADEVLAG